MTIETPRILIIDDDRAFRVGTGALLADEGYAVDASPGGDEGLERLRSDHYDMVLLDLKMEGRTGLSVLQELRVSGNDVPVLMLTGYATVDSAVQALKLGADDYLTKPCDNQVLRQKIRTVLARREPVLGEGTRRLVATTTKMREVLRAISRVAPTESTVLLRGETGSGKEVIARALHEESPRRARAFVAVNCSSLAEGLLESELFGHARGAFTGAVADRKGLFEEANAGTLFLDEIGDLSSDLQPKLLRVLETRTFRRLGGTREIQVDVRLIAATNKDLAAEVRAGRFREDLFYRLSVFPLTIPPLRERSREDVLELVHEALRQLHLRHPASPDRLSDKALDLLLGYAWPGNVRELRNVLERALVLSPVDDGLGPEHLPEALRAPGAPRAARLDSTVLTLEEVERQHIERTLYLSEGNRTLAAQRLAISRATLHAKIKQYGLERVGRDEEATA